MRIGIVTGASSGMGREAVIQIADRFGEKKIQEIWVIARRLERLEELRKQVPVPLRVFPLDLTEENALDMLRRELKERKPKVSILVNAAGYGKLGMWATIIHRSQMIRNAHRYCSPNSMYEYANSFIQLSLVVLFLNQV